MKPIRAFAIFGTIAATVAAATPTTALAAVPPDLQEIQLQELLEDAIEAHKSEVVIEDEYNISYETGNKLLNLYYGNGIEGVASEKQTRFLLYANHWGVKQFPS